MGPDLNLGGQEDGIAMKGAQSNVKWGEGPMGAHGVNGRSHCLGPSPKRLHGPLLLVLLVCPRLQPSQPYR